jgi:hypothetical protein
MSEFGYDLSFAPVEKSTSDVVDGAFPVTDGLGAYRPHGEWIASDGASGSKSRPRLNCGLCHARRRGE